jgi:hypothetical protein
MAEEYTEQFFQALREGVTRSAEVMVPIVVEMTRPASVVDVGCGAGGWLAAFARHGVRDYLGIDGYAPEELLEIPRDRFLAADGRSRWTAPSTSPSRSRWPSTWWSRRPGRSSSRSRGWRPW